MRATDEVAVLPLASAALHYAVEYGLALIPLEDAGKKPRTANGFHDASAHPEQIGAWWDQTPHANIGAVPGSIGCVVVDIDGADGEAFARSLDVLRVDTVHVLTTKGRHVWLRLPLGMRVGNLARKALDVRAHAGYVLLPPSVHPSGPRYGLVGSFDHIANAPAAFVAWLGEAATLPRRAQPPAGFPTASRDADVTRRVAAYMRRMPPLAAGEGINCAMYRLAAFCVHECLQPASEAFKALQVQNERNHDRMREERLAEILANAAKYGARAA